MNVSVPVSSEIKQVAFSFASNEEIKKLSAKLINNPVTFDPATMYPNVGGLYDPSLGPLDKQQLYASIPSNILGAQLVG
jgi:DNA-directed RNA polymerase beta' subunit